MATGEGPFCTTWSTSTQKLGRSSKRTQNLRAPTSWCERTSGRPLTIIGIPCLWPTKKASLSHANGQIFLSRKKKTELTSRWQREACNIKRFLRLEQQRQLGCRVNWFIRSCWYPFASLIVVPEVCGRKAFRWYERLLVFACSECENCSLISCESFGHYTSWLIFRYFFCALKLERY